MFNKTKNTMNTLTDTLAKLFELEGVKVIAQYPTWDRACEITDYWQIQEFYDSPQIERIDVVLPHVSNSFMIRLEYRSIYRGHGVMPDEYYTLTYNPRLANIKLTPQRDSKTSAHNLEFGRSYRKGLAWAKNYKTKSGALKALHNDTKRAVKWRAGI